MQICTVNRPSTSLKGPVEVPQKEQCGPTPHTLPCSNVCSPNDSSCRVPLRRFEGGPGRTVLPLSTVRGGCENCCTEFKAGPAARRRHDGYPGYRPHPPP